MKASMLKVYYKAAAWPPFYAIAGPSIIVILSRYFYDRQSFSVTGLYELLVMASFYSGMIAVSCISLFFCTKEKVARSLFYSLLSWFLLPLLVMAYIFFVKLDVSSINHPKNADMLMVAIMATVCMFHLIGLVISFQDFRASMILEMEEEKNGGGLKKLYPKELVSMDDKVS